MLLAALIAFFMQASISDASISIKSKTYYYQINGSTTGELKAQMRKKGPNGHWAYAVWFIDWDNEGCDVSVKINYIYPNWTNINKAPNSVQLIWRKMIRALKKHEKNHARNGIMAGRAIHKNKCKNPGSTIHKWSAKDQEYDRNTGHGKTEGVVLP